jgi:hypothetical protein
MKAKKIILQISVENQRREFDSKPLLACVAAERGFSFRLVNLAWLNRIEISG